MRSHRAMTQPPPSHFTTVAGVTYHYHDLGEGTPTIFLHGGGPGCTAWSDFGSVAPLFAADRRCLLVDLLQYGRSDKSEIEGPMWDHHAAKLVALMDDLGIERADFVCNSWGGHMALKIAADLPERVRTVTITGSMPVFRGPLGPLPENGHRGRSARDRYYGGEGPTKEKLRELITGLEWYDGDRLPEETLEMRYRQSLDPEEMALAGGSDNPRGEWQDIAGDLGRIQAPVLMAWGMYDGFLTPDYPLMLASMIPHGQLWVMDQASHHLQEERPHDYYRMVSGFLAQHLPGEGDRA